MSYLRNSISFLSCRVIDTEPEETSQGSMSTILSSKMSPELKTKHMDYSLEKFIPVLFSCSKYRSWHYIYVFSLFRLEGIVHFSHRVSFQKWKRSVQSFR